VHASTTGHGMPSIFWSACRALGGIRLGRQ
jgi:hypothetical protein